ncbi:GNAT family N-acetyltransferase [Solirubrobacter sp. CPCC 204708]|uniref:GNAT family N-acetyltransferase n=1 Tax=Solirubrobacter deserti TaxID=2282478 RepID=A0ABT4RCH7_9ACTN|nr:GNAT family N-acetyltransferase [Solirubrobacter deserti]MBE2315587.1 GNAT family N-acetyltransferase [Solirubrobacter deserti]MDA0136226.1 GNAT family N-acetyltransferase [Solirubrobacter deserti]
MSQIAPDDPHADDVHALLTSHLAFIRAHTGPDDDFSLAADELTDAAVTLYSFRAGDGELLGVAALKHLDDTHAELKSMHTAEAARGRGVGRALVAHLLAVARERGYARVSLETGSGPEWVPARTLYARAGFSECEPFGNYTPHPACTFMTRALH